MRATRQIHVRRAPRRHLRRLADQVHVTEQDLYLVACELGDGSNESTEIGRALEALGECRQALARARLARTEQLAVRRAR